MMHYLSSPPIYWGLLATGAVCILQAERIGAIARRVRGRVDYMVAVQMNSEHFVSVNDAVRIVMSSQWGRARLAKNEKPHSIFDFVPVAALQSNPSRDARATMFRNWCRMALSSFEQDEPSAYRQQEKEKIYDEVKLRAWLDDKYKHDMISEFGPV